MRPLLKAIYMGIVTALLGAVIYLLFSGYELEESLGLNTLFKLRGKVPAPPESVIIAIDKVSSDHFKLPNDPAKWPRQLYARLIDRLAAQGAKAIVFDVFFKEKRDSEQDQQLAKSIKQAGNVILFTHLQRDILSRQGTLPRHAEISQAINIERLVMPTDTIASAPAGLAPFALLKYPQQVTRFWAFRVPAGEIPNMPVLALQLAYMSDYKILLRLLREHFPQYAQRFPTDINTILQQQGLAQLISDIRALFLQHPQLGQQLEEILNSRADIPTESKHKIRALLNMYRGPNQHYLNFYGPPRSIRTISFYEVIEQPTGHKHDFRDKVVFVGFSEFLQPEQKDNFYTVFSLESGLDLSGVEIAATAFSNLLHMQNIRTLSPVAFITLILLYGFIIAAISQLKSSMLSVMGVLLVAAGYVSMTYLLFSQNYLWLPWVVPLMIQTPIVLFVALLWRYLEIRRDREHIRRAFGYYLPTRVVDKIAQNVGHLEQVQQRMYGICLATDAEQYTSLAERIAPDKLNTLVNDYYKQLFTPIRKHGGDISDVVGDAMLAIWSAANPDLQLRTSACLAALDITQTINNHDMSTRPEHLLPTRIGLHAGMLMLGNVGAMDHYEYRAVGDIVNTSNRIQELNKTLGSYVIASWNAIEGVQGIITRELGYFRLPGKLHETRLFELMCRKEALNNAIEERCSIFTQGINAVQSGKWDEGCELFLQLLNKYPADKPAQFYLKYCQQQEENNYSDAAWAGIICIDNK